MLAAGLDGIERKLVPPKPIEERVYGFEEDKRKLLGIGTLPASLEEASRELERDSVVRNAIGEHVASMLLKVQKDDWNSYSKQVTPWEKERYFGVL